MLDYTITIVGMTSYYASAKDVMRAARFFRRCCSRKFIVTARGRKFHFGTSSAIHLRITDKKAKLMEARRQLLSLIS